MQYILLKQVEQEASDVWTAVSFDMLIKVMRVRLITATHYLENEVDRGENGVEKKQYSWDKLR